MTRRSAVVVEINAVLDGRLHEAKHLCALMLDGVAIVSNFPGHAKVDAKARPETLYPCDHAVTAKRL